MPRTKEYNPPADMLAQLPKSGTITKGDKLAAFDALLHRADISWRAARVRIFEAIRNDIYIAESTNAAIRARDRAQKGGASGRTEAPPRPRQRSEAGSSIPDRVLERKIETADGTIHISLNIRRDDPALNIITLTIRVPDASEPYTPEEASTIRDALTELVDDVRQDAIARAWSKSLLEATTE